MTRETLRDLLNNALNNSPDLKSTPENGRTFQIGRGDARSDKTRGDFWTNAAHVAAAQSKGDAHRIATDLAFELAESAWPGSVEEENGFLNFRFNDEYLTGQIAAALEQGARFGAGESLANTRVLVEFVSADPTGPLPFGLGRMAAAGDALCRILEFAGADVTREFYLNDVEASPTMRLLGESVAALYASHFGHDATAPEGALADSFVQRVADEIAAREGNKFLLVPDAERNANFAHRARDAAVESQKATLKNFGVRFDVWTSEAALRAEGRLDATLRKLEERGHSYQKEGATWLRTSDFGDRADRVLVRQNGAPTYLASDIAYHAWKFERGFDIVCNIWTSEHREYIERTRAALLAASCDAAKLEVIACQSALWMSDDKVVTRAPDGGNFTLDEAMRAAPEYLRFLLVRADWDAPLSIEAERARRDDESNPAYAAQLLPSRLATMIGQATGVQKSESEKNWRDEEYQLARLIALWPDTAQAAAGERAPHLIAAHVEEMATATRALLKISRPDDESDVDLLRAAKIVATNALGLLGISARDNF